MSDHIENVLRVFPPRPLSDGERQILLDWIAVAEAFSAFFSALCVTIPRKLVQSDCLRLSPTHQATLGLHPLFNILRFVAHGIFQRGRRCWTLPNPSCCPETHHSPKSGNLVQRSRGSVVQRVATLAGVTPKYHLSICARRQRNPLTMPRKWNAASGRAKQFTDLLRSSMGWVNGTIYRATTAERIGDQLPYLGDAHFS